MNILTEEFRNYLYKSLINSYGGDINDYQIDELINIQPIDESIRKQLKAKDHSFYIGTLYAVSSNPDAARDLSIPYLILGKLENNHHFVGYEVHSKRLPKSI